jgi:hypothetical protein
MLERAREVTRKGKYTYIEYARFADDLVILIDAYKRHDWLVGAVDKRLREEFGKLQVLRLPAGSFRGEMCEVPHTGAWGNRATMPDHVRNGRRSGKARIRPQPQPAGRRHRRRSSCGE